MIGPELVAAPDMTEAVVGYRQFVLTKVGQHNYAITSGHTGEVWIKPEMTARCVVEIKVPEGIELPGPPKRHSAPAKSCSCGIYAYFEPYPVYDESRSHHYRWEPTPEYVAALVTMTGRIEVHAKGMRAQRAQIRALGLNRNLNEHERAALRQIAEMWGIPLVAQDDLPKLASEYGRPLTDDAKPAPAVQDDAALERKVAAMEQKAHEVLGAPSGRYVPSFAYVACNGVCALVNVAVWVVWDKPMNLIATAISTGIAGYFFGRRKDLRRR